MRNVLEKHVLNVMLSFLVGIYWNAMLRFCDIGTATNSEPKSSEFSNDNDISDEEPV
jgi:hypothetical protein